MSPIKLPPLSPCQRIDRPLSVVEYYHAAVGMHPATLEPPREVIFVLELEGRLPESRWRQALDAVVAANAGLRLRLHGRQLQACWRSDGEPTRLRVIADQGWDGRGDAGAAFITEIRLGLNDAPASELLVEERGAGTRLVFRALHAVADGKGVMHALHELFRALRGERLIGTNAAFSDTDIMRAVRGQHVPRPARPRALRPADPVGAMGDSWCRLTLRGPQSALLGRLAIALSRQAYRMGDGPVSIAVPVDLRRHVPGLHTTCNAASVLYVGLAPEDNAEQFREKLHAALERQGDAAYVPGLGLFKLLPLMWFDRIVSRTRTNYRHRKPPDTVMISNLGGYAPASLSCPGLRPKSLYGVPLVGGSFAFLFSLGDTTEITLGMPRVLGDVSGLHGIMDALRRELSPDEALALSVSSAFG